MYCPVRLSLRQIIATTALSLVLSANAQADNVFNITDSGGNAITRNQTGDQQNTSGSIDGVGNTLAVSQTVYGNKLNVNVTGDNNSVRSNTNGGNNNVAVGVGSRLIIAPINGTPPQVIKFPASKSNVQVDVNGESNAVNVSAGGTGSTIATKVTGVVNKVDVHLYNSSLANNHTNTSVIGAANSFSLNSSGLNNSDIIEEGANNSMTVNQNRDNAAPSDSALNQLTAETHGEANTLQYTQDGYANTVNSKAIGVFNTHTADQTGHGNTASASALGLRINNTTSQTGNNNAIAVITEGNDLNTTATQKGGDSNQATLTVKGRYNSITSTQTGNGNVVIGNNTGEQNTVTTTQTGNSNKFTATTGGGFNAIAGTQQGNGNSMEATTSGTFNLIGDPTGKNAVLRQVGDNNTGKATMISGSALTLEQVGNNNNALLADGGAHNFANINQVNNGNSASVTFTSGEFNTAKIKQDAVGGVGGANIATVSVGKDSFGNHTEITQSGRNTANVVYDTYAIDNNVILNQKGSGGNSANVHIGEAAVANNVILSQNGTNNTFKADLLPADYKNVTNVSQTGAGNDFAIIVQGERNVAEVQQNGNNNSMSTVQDGVANYIGYAQQGDGLKATIQQYGSGKAVGLTQTAATPVVTIIQK